MKSLFLSAIVAFTAALTGHAEGQTNNWTQKLTTAIREHCPDAAIEATNDSFKAKSGTMMFTLHGRQMTGEIVANTHQEEGPNYKGFVLSVVVVKNYEGSQALTPQELKGPYYPTFIDDPATENPKDHYWIVFSYGSRLDPKLKQAIFDALPKRDPKQKIEPPKVNRPNVGP